MAVTIEDQFVGKKLRERRVLLGVSQSTLGKSENISFQQIQKFEVGKNRISAGRLYRFSKILHVHIYYFFEGIDKVIEKSKLAGLEDVSDITKLRVLDAKTDRLDIEINKLNKNFLKIKNMKLRKSIVDLAKGLAESEVEDRILKSEDRNININKK